MPPFVGYGIKESLVRGKLGRVWRVYKTTGNWYEVLLVHIGLKRSCVAQLRSGHTVLVSKEAWPEYWKHITVEFLKAKLRNLSLSENTASFEYLGKRIALHFPKEVNLDTLLSTFFYEDYVHLNIASRCVIDVGAYIGDTAIYFALRGTRKVFALEPYPYTYSLLVKNIKINSLDSIIKPINIAIASKDGVIHLLYTEEDTIAKPAYGSAGVEVVCCKLSTLIERLKRNFELAEDLVLKMDCEGCEYDAILGSDKETLRAFREIILEFHGDPKPLIDKLKGSGFKVEIISRNPKLNTGFLYAIRESLSLE
ncbi:FkbM family methyltransferase [Infirmifilum sp. SLHALR2]|nr:MAG: hypothetical protein B7L53_01660 [Thermofilum sp. NZ13]